LVFLTLGIGRCVPQHSGSLMIARSEHGSANSYRAKHVLNLVTSTFERHERRRLVRQA
jgi:hypothetical protein